MALHEYILLAVTRLLLSRVITEAEQVSLLVKKVFSLFGITCTEEIRPEAWCINKVMFNLDFMLPLSMQEWCLMLLPPNLFSSISGKVQQALEVGYRHETRLAGNKVSLGRNTETKINGTVKET